MDADWGGLETLLAAAEFVESQEQTSQKLIEICEEYPTSEKTSYSTESASSLTPVQSVAVVPTSSAAPPAPSKSSPFASESLSANASRSVISSTVSALSLTNGSSSPAMVVASTLPSFSPSPSLTFTFTTPSAASQTVAPLLKIPPTPVRLPTTTTAAAAVTSPRHNPPPPSLVIQQNVSHSPPHTLAVAHLPQQQQQQPAQGTVSILPHRTPSSYPERPAMGLPDLKRKLINSGTREVHNKLEKNRRAHLKECFELLKSQVPAIQDEKKPSNLTILRTAIRYVQILRRREHELETELERLAREKIVNQQRLTTLKKELSAQWDHIDFSSLLPDSIESAKVVLIENGADHHMKYEHDQDADIKISMSDIDDSSSQVKSRGDTYYGSSSPTGSCSISPLHISSPNVVSTTSDTLPPQIHIVESFDKLSNATVVSPLQFLSTSSLRMITDPEQQPIALVQHNGGGDKVTESANTLPKMAVHAGNTFTIFSDSFQKVTAASNTVVTGSGSHVSPSNAKLANSSVQFASGLTLPTVSVNHKTMTLPKSGFSPSAPNGTITSSTIGDKGSTVLTTVPVHSNVGNLVNHSFVVTQPPTGQMLISTTSPHLPTNIMPTPPLLKTVSRLQSINGHQLVMKPATAAVVVVSSSTAASK